MGFPMAENKKKKYVELSSDLPVINTKAVSDKKNEDETSYDKIRDEGAIHQTPTGANVYKGDAVIIPTNGDEVNNAVTEGIKSHIAKKTKNAPRTTHPVTPN